jgi:hypothetical protein
MNTVKHRTTLRLCLIVAALLLWWAQPVAYSQPVITIGDVAACEGDMVEVPVLAENFMDVAAITFYIEIDTLTLLYNSLLNVHQQLAGGQIIANMVMTSSPPALIVTWVSMTPANITQGKLFDLKCAYLGGISILSFDEGCEIVLSDLSLVENAQFKDGRVSPSIDITGQPQNTSVMQGETATFSIIQNGGTDFQWQQNSGGVWEDLSESFPYGGVHSENLSINNTPPDFDGYSYRCRVERAGCEKYSESAMLEVLPVTIKDFAGKPLEGFIELFPVPCTDELFFRTLQDMETFSLQLTDMVGKQQSLHQFSSMPAMTRQSISVQALQPGCYQVRLFQGNQLIGTSQIVKQE